MQERTGKALLKQLLGMFPAVAIVGPRQCGKTTLARTMGTQYFDLQLTEDRLRLDFAWNELVARDELVILDEAQSWPEVFPRLRGAVDARRAVNGRFLLLGSLSPALMKQVGESLAGRLALQELAPFTTLEVSPDRRDALWRQGGYPQPHLQPQLYPTWQQNYLSLLAKRDLPTWGLPAPPAITSRLFKLLAAVHGGMQNASELGKALGITHHTVQTYLDYLEGAFLVRRLPPYHANLSKRLVKTPKIYWRDSGLLHSLLGWTPARDLLAQKWVGESWEGWVIEQILATRAARGQETDAFFFRTSDGLECPLVLESDGRRELLDIRLTTFPSPADFDRLRKIQALIGADRLVLISRSLQTHTTGESWLCDTGTYLAATASEVAPTYHIS